MNVEKKTSDQLAVDRTNLAANRTLMAADRTLMAWVRTALSMISFGFTIYKLMQGFEASGGVLPHANSPRTVGLFLTGLGTVAMVMGLVEYLSTVRDLRLLRPVRVFRPSFVMALMMSVMGISMFFSIITKLL